MDVVMASEELCSSNSDEDHQSRDAEGMADNGGRRRNRVGPSGCGIRARICLQKLSILHRVFLRLHGLL